MVTVLRLIGYWRSEQRPDLPHPGDFVDLGWDEWERRSTVGYLRSGVAARVFMGLSSCRMCGKLCGSVELTDGTYVWPDGLADYVELHGVRPPGEFLEHARHVREAYDRARVDETWWLAQASTRRADETRDR